MKSFTLLTTLFVSAALILSCNNDDTPKSAAEKILINTNADPSNLPAAYGRTSNITVRVFNQNHNPIIGKEVKFSASLGIITAKDSTNENGIATARFEGEPINATARIVISLSHGNRVYTDTQEVKLSGIVVSLAPNVRNALCNETIPIRVFITDAEGKAVTKAKIQITGIKEKKGLTGADGCFKTIVTSKVEKTITIKASSLGAESSCEVSFHKTLPEEILKQREKSKKIKKGGCTKK